MNHYLLWLRYDGTRFHGWQRQLGVRTVQGTLEEGLTHLLNGNFRLLTSSRTDAGVHAIRHPVILNTSSKIPIHGLLRGLNSLLPTDLAVVETRRVPNTFSTRKDAIGKVYRYKILEDRFADPFLTPFCWRLDEHLDITAMRKAARILYGQHDFAAFRSAHCDSVTTIRQITGIFITRKPPLTTITIGGNAFMRNMVRIITGTLVTIGRGQKPVSWMADVLAEKDRSQAGLTAPAQGLFLVGVNYPAHHYCNGAHEF